MNRLSGILVILILVSVYQVNLFSQTVHTEPETLATGSKAPDFSLPGVDGKTYSLDDFRKSPVLVVIFSCNHCPTAQAYEDRIISFSKEYKPKGVDVVVISPNSVDALNYSELGYSDMGDSFDDMKQRASDKGFPFPYLYDGDNQKVALAYGPVATPHCFVFDKERILRYNGRVDGSEKPGTGKGEDLRNAVDALLAGRPVSNPVTKVFGCSVKWAWKNEYTKKLYEQWARLPVTLEEIDVNGVRDLIRNTSSNKLRLINIWATWCGPCKTEFPDLVIIDRMYRGRDFEFITISADKQQRKDDALKFLKSQQASNKNYIFNDDDVYKLIEAVDPDWRGALPFTILIEPGGKIVYKKQDMIDPHEMKKLIVENKYIGRYY
ncbi:MAG TPA: redoxin domain-containing protein [Bacteroidales bacterium]|nr:redoxin domain-containing protein [Bacteroidales bacterium]HQM70183.1 redoxin domain-containing protein [Bacteroidales bacterium]